ncbi:hypothetical protein IAD21_03912 [Abditibacteriota bacterium]|nr:hypothetical protein IAD21_03912 [Abditibacteriota bacterium]
MGFWSRLFSRGEEKEQKQRCINEQALRLSDYNYGERLKELDLVAFPLVEDFTIKTKNTGSFGYHLYFHSDHAGHLASFPWWDNVEKDLPRYTSKDIPVGSLEWPFDDLEQGWQIVICEHKHFVYILEGGDPCCTEFYVWFRVPRQRYYREWMRLIREFNPEA